MGKRLLATLLPLIMLVGLLCPPVSALSPDSPPGPDSAEHWFSDQLTEQGKKIYNAIVEQYASGKMKDGTADFDLVGSVVEASVVEAYLKGNRTLFNDFAAAKDAFDLEHPEAWYIDSSDLSLLVTSDVYGALHAYVGPGRTDDYYVDGVKKSTKSVDEMTAELEREVGRIAGGATGSKADQVRYVHGQITKSISYRFEPDCTPGNAGYIRTAYALVTHEGVCEGYARSFQYVLNKLGIPCVLIHGVQTSGEPEAHMWCAVWLEDEGAGAWYVVDPTWDDPITLDADGGIRDLYPDDPGLDGGETETYLLVGQDVVGGHWRPSGYVSTGTMEFTYPDIALNSYGTGTLERNGLKVTSAADTMENIASTVYHVSFNGDGLVNAAKKGYYFLVRMYDVNADGTMNAFDDWYYSVHGLHTMGRGEELFDPDDDFRDITNSYFFDSEDCLTYNIGNCEYVEFAVTTKAPPKWTCAKDLATMGGYYDGDGSDIIAETGLIFNVNGGYEQTPCVKNVSPLFNSPVYVGQTYTIHMEFTDPLYHPDQESIDHAVAGKVNEAAKAMDQAVALDYRGTTYSWGVNARRPHTFTEKPEPQNVRWICETHGSHSGMDGIGADCALTTLEYEFSASRWWSDDSVQYEFYLTGLVGRKSNKYLANWSYVFENLSAYCSYRCPYGIDWNLWGQPQLLDNPNDLDFDELTVRGVDGSEESLAELRESMQLDDYDMNGRLVLVVENLDASRSGSEELANAMNASDGAILSSSLYEIDFARICGKTIVQTGQSLRMQIGFPPGFDSSMAGVEFKVYHFTRDKAGTITGVEEIPVTVTKYGLVIVVKSFSPFAVVAVKDDTLDDGGDRCVILVSGGNGTVTADSEDKDMPGRVTFVYGSAHTFTVKPADGYELGAVTFDGKREIEVKDNTFTLTYNDLDGGNVLNATFVPTSVKKADETLQTPTVCGHETTTGIPYQAPDCTEKGHTAGKTCSICGQVLSESVELAALGHAYDSQGKCERCGESKVCLITFHANGGTLAGSMTVPTGEDGTLPALPGDPTRDGYSFGGWYRYIGKDGEPVTADTLFVENTTVYALWNREGEPSEPAEPSVPAAPAEPSYSPGPSLPSEPSYPSGPALPSSRPSGGGSSGDNSAAAGGNTTETTDANGHTVITKENPDGSVTTTVADPDAGTVEETTVYPDGSSTVVETSGDGLVITRETEANGVLVTTIRAPGAPVTVSVTIPDGVDAASVTIPAAVTPGTVAIDASSGKVIRRSIPTSEGMVVRLDRSADFILEDRGRDFSDTVGHWAADPIAFVTAHELFSGTGGSRFEPELPMTRAMLMTVLARLDDAETEGGGTWYEKGMAWAVSNGISDGSDPDGQITREQLVTMLWRYAGEPAAAGGLELYSDADSIQDWAGAAMAWAVRTGVINGFGGKLNPQSSALRCEVAAMLSRFCQNAEF